MDVVYNVTEGDRFRVGRINVHISGEFPHTRESVVLDRLSIRPGDIVDIREVRASERRLKSSQLFENDPATGKAPRIVIRPPQLDETGSIARQQGSTTVRGQSPDGQRRLPPPHKIRLRSRRGPCWDPLDFLPGQNMSFHSSFPLQTHPYWFYRQRSRLRLQVCEPHWHHKVK